MSSSGDLTNLLQRARDGDSAAESEVFDQVYSVLRELARVAFRQERTGHTLQPTALVNQAWLKMRGTDNLIPEVKSRGQFFAIAARVMRQILVDHARTKQREKRGGDRTRISLEDTDLPVPTSAVDVLVFNEALESLATKYPRHAKVVQLKWFAGCTNPETAEALGISKDTVKKDWHFARAWLYRELQDDDQ